jgi:hypothetical protein
MGAENWNDPHDIIPEEFREEFADSETVADALRRAALRPSTTSLGDRPRCPECNSTHVSAKASQIEGDENRREGGYKCGKTDCMAHFDEPVYNTAIPMNDNRTYQFEWIEPDDIPDADERTPLDPPLADIDRETAVEVALWLREPWRDAEGPSYTEIARYLPYADSWVGHRVREWRDGEHRELVPNPTAEPEPITVNEQGGATAVATDGGRVRRWDAFGSD